MNGDYLLKAVKWAGVRWFSLICLAVMVGSCGPQEPALSKQAQAFKKKLQGEIQRLSAALIEPVENQAWEVMLPILEKSYANLGQKDRLALVRLGVLDRDGILQVTYPSRKEEHFDFFNFDPARAVYLKKKITQAKLYFGEKKLYIVMAPLLNKDQVIGAVAVAFSEDDLQRTWKVPEKEFLQIDFNQ